MFFVYMWTYVRMCKRPRHISSLYSMSQTQSIAVLYFLVQHFDWGNVFFFIHSARFGFVLRCSFFYSPIQIYFSRFYFNAWTNKIATRIRKLIIWIILWLFFVLSLFLCWTFHNNGFKEHRWTKKKKIKMLIHRQPSSTKKHT